MDTASRTTSFMRNATGPAIAGNPPAELAGVPARGHGKLLEVESISEQIRCHNQVGFLRQIGVL
jgi:hypothetical protein